MNANDLSVAVRIPFRYGVVTPTLAGSAVVTMPLTLDAASSFELNAIYGFSSADSVTAFFNFTVLIAQINGQQWSSLTVNESALSPICTGGLGWRLPLPVILPPRFQMQFTFTDAGAGGVHKVELVGSMLKG